MDKAEWRYIRFDSFRLGLVRFGWLNSFEVRLVNKTRVNFIGTNLLRHALILIITQLFKLSKAEAY